MSVIVPVQLDVNYDEDREKLIKLNPHLAVYFSKGKVSFNVDYEEKDRYVTLVIQLDDLLEAIAKAMREEE